MLKLTKMKRIHWKCEKCQDEKGFGGFRYKF